jgi:hypothetical protein
MPSQSDLWLMLYNSSSLDIGVFLFQNAVLPKDFMVKSKDDAVFFCKNLVNENFALSGIDKD